MSEDREYNGWPNYETWSVALILNNDETSQGNALRLVATVYSEWEPNPRLADFYADNEVGATRRHRAAVDEAAQELRSHVEDAVLYHVDDGDGAAALLSRQLLAGALQDVDWHRIVDALLEDNPHLDSEDDD